MPIPAHSRQSQKASQWETLPDQLAFFRSRGLAGQTGGFTVRIVAQARAGRWYVEAIGRRGGLVKFAVGRINLTQPQPGHLRWLSRVQLELIDCCDYGGYRVEYFLAQIGRAHV